MSKTVIATTKAPSAIGPYSQAIASNGTVYLSGQIPLHPETGELVSDDFDAQVRQALDNLRAVAEAAGGDLQKIVKLNVFMLDLGNFATVNEIMMEYFQEPWPARAAIGVAALPKGSAVEFDAIMTIA